MLSEGSMWPWPSATRYTPATSPTGNPGPPCIICSLTIGGGYAQRWIDQISFTFLCLCLKVLHLRKMIVTDDDLATLVRDPRSHVAVAQTREVLWVIYEGAWGSGSQLQVCGCWIFSFQSSGLNAILCQEFSIIAVDLLSIFACKWSGHFPLVGWTAEGRSLGSTGQMFSWLS